MFTFYRWYLTPFWTTGPLSMQDLRRSRVAQCHQGVEGALPNPSYLLLSWVQRLVAKVNRIHWLAWYSQHNRRLLLRSSCIFLSLARFFIRARVLSCSFHVCATFLARTSLLLPLVVAPQQIKLKITSITKKLQET